MLPTQGSQQALNAIRGEIERVDDETKWAALELMLSTSSSVVALAKKITKPETKTVTHTVAVPKTKIVKQQTQPQTTPKDTERIDFTPIRPQPPLPNQRTKKVTIVKTVKIARFIAAYGLWLTRRLTGIERRCLNTFL